VNNVDTYWSNCKVACPLYEYRDSIEMIKDGESNEKIRKYTGFMDDDIEKLRRGR
jgi:uncharacterized radical SAM superfamily protein